MRYLSTMDRDYISYIGSRFMIFIQYSLILFDLLRITMKNVEKEAKAPMSSIYVKPVILLALGEKRFHFGKKV